MKKTQAPLEVQQLRSIWSCGRLSNFTLHLTHISCLPRGYLPYCSSQRIYSHPSASHRHQNSPLLSSPRYASHSFSYRSFVFLSVFVSHRNGFSSRESFTTYPHSSSRPRCALHCSLYMSWIGLLWVVQGGENESETALSVRLAWRVGSGEVAAVDMMC